MTVCDLCKGTGRLIKPWYDTTGAMMGMTGDVCFMCDGKGTIGQPMTNEEWLKKCDTEQLADKLTDFSFWLVVTIPTEDKRERVRKRIVEWLKQPHTVKE